MIPLRNPVQRPWFTTILLGLSFLFILGCGSHQFLSPMMLVRPDDSAGWGPNALTWNGRDLIMADGSLVISVTRINTDRYNANGTFIFGRDPFSLTKITRICGLAWEGECCGNGFLWVLNSEKKEIVKYDVELNVLKRIAAPGYSPRGLAFDGKDLWLADMGNKKIYRISVFDGKVISEFESPLKSPMGVASDCKNLWVIGMDSCKNVNQGCDTPRLVQMNPKDGKIIDEISVPSEITRPTAMVWADGTIWIGDYNLNRIFKVSVNPLIDRLIQYPNI